jgi:homoserine dehydrogenase
MSDLPVLPMSEVVTSYYLRLRVADQAGVLAKVTGILADAGISIDAVLQREADEVGGEGLPGNEWHAANRPHHPHARHRKAP